MLYFLLLFVVILNSALAAQLSPLPPKTNTDFSEEAFFKSLSKDKNFQKLNEEAILDYTYNDVVQKQGPISIPDPFRLCLSGFGSNNQNRPITAGSPLPYEVLTITNPVQLSAIFGNTFTKLFNIFL